MKAGAISMNAPAFWEDSKIKLDQLRVIDKSRLVKKMGHLEADYHVAVFQAIDVMMDRFVDFRD